MIFNEFLLSRFIASLTLMFIFVAKPVQAQPPQNDSSKKSKFNDQLALLRERGQPIVYNLGKDKETKHYMRSHGTILVPGGDKDVAFNFLYYRTLKVNNGKKSPVIFIYSGIGGITILEKVMAHYYTKKGISVVISHYFDKDDIYQLEKSSANSMRTLKASLLLTDYVASLPETDENRLALIGISYGGIRGAYHAALDTRIKGAALIVAGVPLPEVMAYSKLPFVREIREKQMQNAGIHSLGEYLKVIRELGDFEMGELLSQRSSDHFYLFISSEDDWVPTRYQWNLWNLLGRPQYEYFGLGHIGTPVWVGVGRLRSTLDFFRKKWNWTLSDYIG